MEENAEETGLTTEEALNRLHKDVQQVLNQYKSSQKNRKAKSWIKDSLHHGSQHTTINWISLTLLFVIVLVLIISYIITQETVLFIYEAILILALLGANVTYQLYDNRLRHNEIPNRVKYLLNLIEKRMKDTKWLPDNYPNLCSPISPCITLQWTYRDKRIVNLPWALLVRDDVILVRAGQISPGYCECLEKNTEYPLLHAKEVYGPSLQTANEIFSIPKSRKPLECKKYRLLETPYLNNLRVALEQALDRPVTQHNQQRHLVMVKLIERIILPTLLLVVVIVNLLRFIYLESYIGRASPVDLFLWIPIATVLPLLPLIFPMAWNLLTYFGLARFKTLFEEKRMVEMNTDVFEEQDNGSHNHLDLKMCWRKVWTNFSDIVTGKSDLLARSANILHVLGSLTALCCIDKKGILSWPNPTAEKVFFLHNTDNLSDSSSLANLGELHVDGDSLKNVNFDSHPYHEDGQIVTVGEVLDLTHNQSDPFRLHFDDTKWHKHLSSLKPLGLAILLNTCNLDTQEHYTKFCSHITCEAMYNENLVPVINRRCLCELAKEIGFLEQAQKIFSLEQQLSTFRHLQPEMVRRDNKYARSLSMSTKLKFPFPHMFAVVVKELSSGSMQLLSQGTADIILDSCVDYWDGHDLCPLTPSDRKKVQDFYQRSSLTAYCTAFAYRPLSKGVSDKLSEVYLELPSDCRSLYHNHRSPTPVHWECSRSVLEPKIKTPLGQFYSTDSLLYNDSPCTDVSDTESCFDMQCNQVFIGMVTMQYQAQSDMVQLIEQLERACIRFVHFSKENELRSRVFSEKMGLESGWNCHISLLSDRNRVDFEQSKHSGDGFISTRRRISQSARKLHSTGSPPYNSNLESSRTMSFSAPSAINMEHSVVKFDTESVPLMKQSVKENMENHDNQRNISQDSVHVQNEMNNTQHDWQSLSCLTDSTEQSNPINFDMSNRAKLPRGIDKIRPHIEKIDNVPLLVSLFTDCTASGTREMLHIMQEYGEVVCVMGSSSNNENMGIFMQADASVAVEPLYPQVCQKMEPYKFVDGANLSPIELARFLNSIACSLSLRREDSVSIYHLILESRHYVSSIWNTVQFWLCCCISVSFMQVVAALLMLPALLTPGQVLWIICVVVPLLSISLMGAPVDNEIMKQAQGKNQIVFNTEVAVFALWYYGIKFFNLIFVVILTFAGTLSGYCQDFCDVKNCTCLLFYLPNFDDNTNINNTWTDLEHSYTLLTAQHFTVVVITLHFVVISSGFVHRQDLFKNKSPHTNIFWLIAVVTLVIIQPIFTVLSLKLGSNSFDAYNEFHMKHVFQIVAILSPILTLVVNEFVKNEEIKVNLRYQRRARLDFGTKLGMNSPF